MHFKYLQVEATTKCNAWCPGCGRNVNGYGLNPDLVIQDLDTERFNQVLSGIEGLEVIDFCGTYGDAIAAKNIEQLISIAKQYCQKLVIRTNGSLRNTEWWTDFAKLLENTEHEVWFCLDGLADTHSIYRQGTDFDTIISNAKTFMSNGGTAVWQFIPWAHNEHQIKDCIQLSQKLGFKRFEFVKDVRQRFVSRHYTTGQVIDIRPWRENNSFSKYEKSRSKLTADNCRHLSQPSLYLNANGKVSNCCFFNTQICSQSILDLPDIAQELSNPRQICLHYCSN